MNARIATESVLERVRQLVERSDEPPTLQALADAAQLSPAICSVRSVAAMA